MSRWGVHPVLGAALDAFGDEDVPPEVEDSLPKKSAMSTRDLLNASRVCLQHARPYAGAASRFEFERLAALVERQFTQSSSWKSLDLEPWQRELSHTERDIEYARGALLVAAMAAQVAWLDIARSAPGAGVEAVKLTTRTVERTARLLRRDPAALRSFVLALCRAAT